MTTHRMSKTPEWYAWQHAKKRCNDPRDKEFKRYGAMGIRMDPAWEDNFPAFLTEVGPRPTPEHSLDRKDGSKGYEPGNVRWATKEQQAQNRPGFVRPVTLGSKTQTVAEWARELGLPATTVYQRLNNGQTPEQALALESRPRGTTPRDLTLNGKTDSLKGWARTAGIKATTLRERLKRGWELERAVQPM